MTIIVKKDKIYIGIAFLVAFVVRKYELVNQVVLLWWSYCIVRDYQKFSLIETSKFI